MDNSDSINEILESLRSSNSAVRCAAIKQSALVAQALGPQRTYEEFVPFLNEFTDDDDEVLTVLAEEVANLLPMLGGEQAHLLLTILERLAGSDEVIVRETACRSIALVMQTVTKESFEQHILPMYRQLASKSWAASRASAIILFPKLYCCANLQLRPDLVTLFNRLCEDQNPTVRRTYVQTMRSIIEICGDDFNFVRGTLYHNLCRLSLDELDSVRVLVPITLSTFALIFRRNGEPVGVILELILQLGKDGSWRIRHAVATRLAEVWAAAKPISAAQAESLLVCFLNFLHVRILIRFLPLLSFG